MQLMERSNKKSPEVLRAILSRAKVAAGLSPELTGEELINPSIGFRSLSRGGAGVVIPPAPSSPIRSGSTWLANARAEIAAELAKLPKQPLQTLERAMRFFETGHDEKAIDMLQNVKLFGSEADRVRAGRVLHCITAGFKSQAVGELAEMIGA